MSNASNRSTGSPSMVMEPSTLVASDAERPFRPDARVESGAPAQRSGASIRVEHVLWFLLLAMAVATRFYDLGSRALHHDESLHAYYSWLLAEGRGYIHNPLMHGPFLFHIDALFYLIFGDSDAVSRMPAALAGVALVGLPWFLRGPAFLGRWGALASGLFILLSPSILFYTRFIRHDPFTLVGVLLLLICIVRYLDEHERKWLITGSISIAFLFTNHEIVFANLAIFFGYLYAVLAFDRLRVWHNDPQRRHGAYLVVIAHVVAAVGLVLVFALSPHSSIDEILEIPWQNPTNEQQMEYYKQLATNPLVLGTVAVALVSLTLLVMGLRQARWSGADGNRSGGALLTDAPDGSVAAGVRSAWSDATGLGIALIAGVFVFVALFTTLFTHLGGLATSTFATDGTLLYWLGQHEVQRGSQPWFYYLLLMPQYEYIGVLFGLGASLVVMVRALAVATGRQASDGRLFFQGLLVVWFLGIFVGLSFAGEKMPWLIIHIALPALLLAGMATGRLIERLLHMREIGGVGRSEWILAGTLLVIGGCGLALAARMTRPIYHLASDGVVTREVSAWASDHWWLLVIPPMAALVALTIAVVVRGPQRAALALSSSLIVGLLFLQVHSGMRMTYLEGDVPRDMLIYTQTSPDVPMIAEELREFSLEIEGNLGLEILYDSRVNWPLQWYLRDFNNRRAITAGSQPPTAPVLVISTEQYNQMGEQLEGYTAFDYVLRWWFPEEMYRQFAIAPELDPARSAWGSASNPHGPIDVLRSIVDSIAGHDNPAAQQELYRLLMYRELTSPIGQYRLKLMIRNDLVPVFNGIRF